MAPAEIDALLTLTLAPGFGPAITRRCLDALGSAGAVVGASARQLAGIDGIGPRRAADLRAALDRVAADGLLPREHALIRQHGVRLVALGEPDYPPLLKHIHDPPPLLYVRGELREADALSLAIVGARQCTGYGREQADRFAGVAAQAGMTIVSGGAYGIDAAAHRAALRVGGRTIAVLGSGLANIYPKNHGDLFDQIAAGHGAVVSELPMTAPPMKENFPSRNRIISGLALGVLVVEASLRSGALITARLAAEEHGREVMAVPGSVDSQASAGCHKLIRDGGATLVTNAAEVLDALGEAGQTLKAGLMQPAAAGEEAAAAPQPSLFDQGLTESQRKVMAALDGETRGLDQLAAATALPVATLQADLTVLQIRGLVSREGGGFARRK